MYICKVCGCESERYPSLLLCKKCYQKEYNKQYYQRKKEKIKKATKEYYISNVEKQKESRKKYREKINFDNNRSKVLKRDNYSCSSCGKKETSSNLIVHHKDRLGRNSDIKNNELDNLVTLCRSCHAIEHSKDLKEALIEKYNGKWSIKYDSCIECGTTERGHQGKGLCTRCHARLAYKKKENNYYEWSKKHKQCIKCGTTTIKHLAKGLCQKCYDRERKRKKEEDIV